ncbi:hypothetical protein HOLleu_31381 [Holothuria leucospilota]|uniref:Uncharacterized protein n=1 Tax=Holothuria leucospilota TaxID=206669 RepID=A0A9Q0YQ58_HOLLE|nr:hypothetical protein HOLleu_31381 [Holothuria leucospilota]
MLTGMQLFWRRANVPACGEENQNNRGKYTHKPIKRKSQIKYLKVVNCEYWTLTENFVRHTPTTVYPVCGELLVVSNQNQNQIERSHIDARSPQMFGDVSLRKVL